MAEVEWVELGERLEVRSPMRVGMRVVFALLGLFPLIAPYELLVRLRWTTYLHPFFALAAVISLGATALSAFLFFAAAAGLSSGLVFDRATATVRAWSWAPIVRRTERVVPWSHILELEIAKTDWTDGSPTYRLRIVLADGTALESGSSWSRHEVERLRDAVARFLAG